MSMRNQHASSLSTTWELRALCLASALLLSSLSSGCNLSHWLHNDFKVGPEYGGPPPAFVGDDWIDSQDALLLATLPDHPDWWSVFNDPVLNRLIETAYAQNLSLREAGNRVMQARARRAITAGNLFPQTQQAFGGFEHVQESTNVAIPPPLRTFDEWTTGFNLSWELDVWGRFRRSVASADADVEMAVGDYDAILICLMAEVATAYTDYRTFQQRLKFAQHNVKIQEESLKLTEEKADAGATGYTSVHLAKSSLEATRSGIPNLAIGLRQAGNQLCTLLGIPTRDLSDLLGSGDIPTAPADVGVGIPADLLRRRPDIRAAERAVAAQSEQIGIAIADIYPHFSINGQISLDSEKFSKLFTSGSSAGVINPSFSWDLLNYGRIVNNVRLQGYGLEELIASYQNQVLTANQEVEDALVEFLNNHQRLRHLEATEAETEQALKLLTISFEEGEISFTGVFVIQTTLVAQQDQLAQAQGAIVTSLISLYKALGGGWEVRCRGFPPNPTIAEPHDASNPAPEPEPIPPPSKSEPDSEVLPKPLDTGPPDAKPLDPKPLDPKPLDPMPLDPTVFDANLQGLSDLIDSMADQEHEL